MTYNSTTYYSAQRECSAEAQYFAGCDAATVNTTK